MAAYRRVFMIHVTCRLTAKNRDQLRNPTLGNRVWLPFISVRIRLGSVVCVCVCVCVCWHVYSWDRGHRNSRTRTLCSSWAPRRVRQQRMRHRRTRYGNNSLQFSSLTTRHCNNSASPYEPTTAVYSYDTIRYEMLFWRALESRHESA